jgi:hypothetical protein
MGLDMRYDHLVNFGWVILIIMLGVYGSLPVFGLLLKDALTESTVPKVEFRFLEPIEELFNIL